MVFANFLQSFSELAMFEVFVLAFVYYYVFLFLRGTRGAQVLVGLVIVIVALQGATYFLHLNELNWLLRKLSVYVAIALLVIFQPEIRRALAELGRQPVFNATQQTRSVIDHLVQTVVFLADHKVGALIAIERDIGIRAIRETGTRIDAPVVPELLSTIFFPHTPLHDGGVVIKDSRIAAASCIFPLSQQADLHKSLGTRHRAAVGLTEETDAVVVIVSEETGTISVSYRGRLSRGLDEEKLRRFLVALLKGRKADSVWRRMQEQLDLTPEGIAKSESRSNEEAASAS
jgi:diadenylate cyclase